MLKLLEKFFSKGKIINIENKKHRKKNIVYNGNYEISVFEIKSSFKMDENHMLICGKVLQGFFKVGECVKICGHKKNNPKLDGKIVKITTSLVEANKVRRGVETDMLIAVENVGDDKIYSGNKIYKK